MKFPSIEFFEKFKVVNGALSTPESIAIYNLALQAPAGLYLELGSHKGKSGMSASLGLKDGVFILVDPIFEDVELAGNVCEVVQSSAKNEVSVVIVPDYSTNVIEKYNNLSFVFVDSGSHADGLPMQEVKMLEDRIVPEGIIAFHDYNSQFHEVKEACDYLVRTGKYEQIPIDWESIVSHVKENEIEKGNSTWHHTEMEFPCFVGAVRRK